MWWCRVRAPQRVQHTAWGGNDIGVAEIVVGELGDCRCLHVDAEYRCAPVLVGGDDQCVAVAGPGQRTRPTIPLLGDRSTLITEPQLLQAHSWSTMRGGDRVPGERDPRSVRRDHPLFEARLRIVSNHATLARRQLDSHPHGPLSGTGPADAPACDEEAATSADIH